MKKLICTLLGVAMTASLLTGCGNGNSQTSVNEGQNDNAAVEENVEAADTADVSDDVNAADSAEQVTLTFWSWLPTLDQWDNMVEAFEAENPNIKVEYTRSEDVEEKLKVAMASGTGPDLFGMTRAEAMLDPDAKRNYFRRYIFINIHKLQTVYSAEPPLSLSSTSQPPMPILTPLFTLLTVTVNLCCVLALKVNPRERV